MLQAIRDRAQGWIAWVIVILITIPFALWGIQEYLQRDARVIVARVNDVEITDRQLQRAHLQQRQRLQALFGRADIIDDAQLRREALRGLVEQEVLSQALYQAGYRISDRQLAQDIRSLRGLQENGAFSPFLYDQFLRSQGLAVAAFEAQMRRSATLEQLYGGVVEGAFTTERDLAEFARLQFQQRDLAFLTLPADRFLAAAQVEEADLQAFYEQNMRRFITPEQVAIEYVELDAEQLAARVNVDEQTLRTYYRERAHDFTAPEQRRASHILIAVPADADEAQVAAARTEAEALLQRIEQGADFPALAREHSQDPGSAAQGGDLGFFGPGDMEQAFDATVFAMAPGELAGPVRTSFGFHVIQLTGVEPGTTRGFAEVREDLERQYRRRQAELQFFEQAEALAALAYEHPDTLEAVARELGLEVKSTGLFDRRGGEDIARDPRVVEAAFGHEVLEQGYNSEVIELAPDHFVVLRVQEHQPAEQLDLAEVRDTIVEQLRQEQARAEAQRLADEIVAQVRAGQSLAAVAQRHELNLRRAEGVVRDTQENDVPDSVLRLAFRLPHPADAAPAVGATLLASGDQAIVAVHAVRDGALEELDEAARALQLRALRESIGDALYEQVVAALTARADVRIYEERL